MTYYVGLDVALRAWLLPIRDDIEILGLEAGTLTQYLTYGLQAADYPIVYGSSRRPCSSGSDA